MLAITGGTGFVGRRVLALAKAPWKALTRRPQAGSGWITGDLADTAALARLCEGADAVIHIAGVVNAADKAGFEAGNITGTANVLAAARAAGVRRFVHVSSLAAREPGLSDYGASKAGAEALVRDSGLDWVMVRPPGVYGPGDTEMLQVFRAAGQGLGLAPGRADGRFSLIHVDDLARALLMLTEVGPSYEVTQEILELDDGAGAQGGYTHHDFHQVLAAALGRSVRTLAVPPAVLNTAAGLATLFARTRGQLPKLSRDRARYLAHPDWVTRGGNARIGMLWTPEINLADGLATTIAHARAQGLL